MEKKTQTFRNKAAIILIFRAFSAPSTALKRLGTEKRGKQAKRTTKKQFFLTLQATERSNKLALLKPIAVFAQTLQVPSMLTMQAPTGFCESYYSESELMRIFQSWIYAEKIPE